ncbi:hypothetical protein Tco_0864500 [Tanacetum coccineum]
MLFDELYKFSDGTLTRLLSLLEDITKNIDIEYLPKRRWSNLEKKRAHFRIKDINKLLKERRMMRSLEKFVGGIGISNLMIHQNWRDLPGISNVSENKALGNDTKGRKVRIGNIWYEMVLTLEQTQHGVLYEVANIRVISITMKMEILLEPTSNKLMVERVNTTAGNPVKKILLKLNLSYHRSILTDSKEYLKMVSFLIGMVPDSEDSQDS